VLIAVSGFRTFVKFHEKSVNDALGMAFGYAIVCKVDGQPYFDTQGDHIPEESMLSAAAEFMQSERVGKEMHKGDQVGQVVFAIPLTDDIMEANGIVAEKSGLFIGWKPSDPSVLAKIKDGTYKGFSIGGERITDEAVAL
jgi:hypothetical protein